MQHQRIVTTGAIVVQTADVQQGFETRLSLCSADYRFKLEPPVSEEDVVEIIRNLCEIVQEGWLIEELLRREAGWIGLGMST